MSDDPEMPGDIMRRLLSEAGLETGTCRRGLAPFTAMNAWGDECAEHRDYIIRRFTKAAKRADLDIPVAELFDEAISLAEESVANPVE